VSFQRQTHVSANGMAFAGIAADFNSTSVILESCAVDAEKHVNKTTDGSGIILD
jgi:hypothetical protein